MDIFMHDILTDGKRILFSLSGGADSACLLYELTKYSIDYNTPLDITLWCAVDLARPGNDKCAQNILDAISKKLNYEYKPLTVQYFDTRVGTKTDQLSAMWYAHDATGKYDLYIAGTNASPSVEEMKKDPIFYYRFMSSSEVGRKERDVAAYKPSLGGMDVWKPYINIDKKEIAKKYKQHDLMGDVFPLTHSCVSRDKTPCMDCYWCCEKYWAFGQYDSFEVDYSKYSTVTSVP